MWRATLLAFRNASHVPRCGRGARPRGGGASGVPQWGGGGGELGRRAAAAGKVAEVLVQVNLAGEATKGGFAPDELKGAVEALGGLSALRVRGLMTIPPPVEHGEQARAGFRRLRGPRDEAGLEHLSMGMSDDFEVAVEEGATMVRVGTAIFGPRA